MEILITVVLLWLLSSFVYFAQHIFFTRCIPLAWATACFYDDWRYLEKHPHVGQVAIARKYLINRFQWGIGIVFPILVIVQWGALAVVFISRFFKAVVSKNGRVMQKVNKLAGLTEE